MVGGRGLFLLSLVGRVGRALGSRVDGLGRRSRIAPLGTLPGDSGVPEIVNIFVKIEP